MKVLYSAIDQTVPAAHGGAVHVTSVAEGLAARGHEVHVLASPSDTAAFPAGAVAWWPVSPPFRDRHLRLLRAPDVLRRARALQPDVVIERYYNFGGEGMLAARRVGAIGVLEVNAPVVDYPGSAKQWIDRLLILQPLRRWRDWQCRAADLIVTPSARILPDDVPAARVLRTEWGADTDRFHPAAAGPAPFSRTPDDIIVIFVGAFRPWHGAIHLVEAIRALRARGRTDIKAVLIGEGPELIRVRRAAEGVAGITFTGALPHDRIPASLAAADIGIAPFDVAAHPSLQSEFHWSPLKIFEYMAAGLPVIVPRIERLTHIVRDGREGALYDGARPDSLTAAIERLANSATRAQLGAAARARAVEKYSWRSHCEALDRAIILSAMRILIATDAFPPVSGGSGWSTYELARGLRAKGHELVIVQPYEQDPPPSFDGFHIVGFPAPAPRVPFVRNYFRNERLYRRLGMYLSKLISTERIDLIHAQHELTGPAAVAAAKAAGVPSVCTVRDYWPLCYWSDLVRDPRVGDICPGCTPGAMTRCLPPRAGGAWPLAAPLIPYMRANLRRKQASLADADALVAVSGRVAAYLRERAPSLVDARIETIPNGVDVGGMRAHVRASARPLDRPYALFIGKLAHNKGAGAIIDIVQRAQLAMPLVVIGDGPERRSLVDAASRSSVEIRILEWLDRQEVFRWLGHASFLIFPSNWPEPLSRVLLEASALCVPIAAMNTGGTSDAIADEETGLLSSSPLELAGDVARLAADPALRRRLGAEAGKRAESQFDIPIVVSRMEQLYRELVG